MSDPKHIRQPTQTTVATTKLNADSHKLLNMLPFHPELVVDETVFCISELFIILRRWCW